MTPPRFIAFISRQSEIDIWRCLAPEAEFAFASFSKLDGGCEHVDPSHLPRMVGVFARQHAERPFAGVLNRKEKCVVPASVLANELHLPPLLAEPLLARDKHRMRLALNAGETFPRSILLPGPEQVGEVPDDMFPCVLKPRFGFNSRAVCLVNDRKDLRRMFAILHGSYKSLPKQDGTGSDFVVEDLITGSEHTIESLVKDGRVLWHLLSDKDAMTPPFFIEGGDLMPSRLPPAEQDQCRMAVAEAVRRIGVQNGWTHTELRFHHGRPVIIECAARMGGGYFEQLIAEVFGIDRARLLIDLFLGHALPPEPRARCHVAARRLVAYGEGQVLALENPQDLFDHSQVRLIWPESVDAIRRRVAGPPHDFNNTVFEFFARDHSPAAALALADTVQRQARVRPCPDS